MPGTHRKYHLPKVPAGGVTRPPARKAKKAGSFARQPPKGNPRKNRGRKKT